MFSKAELGNTEIENLKTGGFQQKTYFIALAFFFFSSSSSLKEDILNWFFYLWLGSLTLHSLENSILIIIFLLDHPVGKHLKANEQ